MLFAFQIKDVSSEEHVDLIEFRPDCPGRHKIVVTYGSEEVAQSPIVYNVNSTEKQYARSKDNLRGQVSVLRTRKN